MVTNEDRTLFDRWTSSEAIEMQNILQLWQRSGVRSSSSSDIKESCKTNRTRIGEELFSVMLTMPRFQEVLKNVVKLHHRQIDSRCLCIYETLQNWCLKRCWKWRTLAEFLTKVGKIWKRGNRLGGVWMEMEMECMFVCANLYSILITSETGSLW
jgi:hypothetical protein